MMMIRQTTTYKNIRKREMIAHNKIIKDSNILKILRLFVDIQFNLEYHCNNVIYKTRRILGSI